MAAGLTRPTPAHQDAPFRRQGRSERRGESDSLPYVEPLSKARTKLADFCSILLDRYPARLAHCAPVVGRRSQMPKSLVILGAGYTARAVRLFAARRYTHVLLTSREPERRLLDMPPDQRIGFDLDRQDTWKNIPPGCDLLWCFPAEPLHLVQACIAELHAASRRLVILGSTSAYPPYPSDEYPPPWIDESGSLDGTQARVQGEEFARIHCRATILRVAGIYGPGRNPLNWIRNGRVGFTRKYVNLIHVEDLAEVCLAALEYGRPGETYNVSDGIPRTWEEICRTAHDRWGIESIRTTGDRSGGKRIAINKLQSLLEAGRKTLAHTDLYRSLDRLRSEPPTIGAGP